MPVLPKTDRTLIDWIDIRINIWKADPASIGLDGAEVMELISRLGAASDAEEAAELARAAAQAQTLRLHIEAEALREQAASMVATIKAYAETQDDPNVFYEAQIPPDRPKSPLGPPPAPTDTQTTLEPGGTVLVAWRGTRKGGTTFLIQRALIETDGVIGPFTLIDTTTDKSWRDTAVPVGVRGVHYRIIAQRRGGRSSPSGLATVSFGTEPTANAARMAA